MARPIVLLYYYAILACLTYCTTTNMTLVPQSFIATSRSTVVTVVRITARAAVV